MGQSSSFDVVSRADLQEVDNAVNQTVKEIRNRYDLKSTSAMVTFDRSQKNITVVADQEFHFQQIVEILHSKLVNRKLSPKVLDLPEPKTAQQSTVRATGSLIDGLNKEQCQSVAKSIKELKLKKINTQIQDDQVRVTGPSRDALQDVIQSLKAKEFPWPLQFINYR